MIMVILRTMMTLVVIVMRIMIILIMILISETRSQVSGGGMILLETLIELKLFNSFLSSCSPLMKVDKQFSVERFEPTASQSTVSFPPPLKNCLPDDSNNSNNSSNSNNNNN